MKLNTFVAALGWISIFSLIWLNYVLPSVGEDANGGAIWAVLIISTAAIFNGFTQRKNDVDR